MYTHTVCAVHDPDLVERPLPPIFTHTPLKEAVLSAAPWHINQMDCGGNGDVGGWQAKTGKLPLHGG